MMEKYNQRTAKLLFARQKSLLSRRVLLGQANLLVRHNVDLNFAGPGYPFGPWFRNSPTFMQVDHKPTQVPFSKPQIEARLLTKLNLKRSRNVYEEMIFSRLADSGAKCIQVDAYSLTIADSDDYKRVIFDMDFYKALMTLVGDRNSSASPNKQKVPARGARNEVDVRVCVAVDEATRLSHLLKDVVESGEDIFHIKTWNQAWKDTVLSSGDYVYFEVFEDAAELHDKMFQVERTFQMWDSCMPKDVPLPKVTGIILNGDRHELVDRVQLIQTTWSLEGKEPKLLNVPMFVIYSKYRNVYLEISKLDAKLDAKFSSLDAKVDAGFSKVTAGLVIVSGLILLVLLLK